MQQFFKNIIIPIVLIIIASAITINCWFEKFPASLMGLVGFLVLGIGSFYIAYYIGYTLFPDKRNKPLPTLAELWTTYVTEKDKPQHFTKGNILGGLLAMLLVTAGIMSWINIGKKFKNYHLEHYAAHATGTITKTGYSKGIGTYREFEFTDIKGIKHKDKFADKTYLVGDTISVIYSFKKPTINNVLQAQEEDD